VTEHPPIEEIWVNVAEGAEKTGYHPDHVRRLARENGRLPEDQRFIRIRKDSHGYAIWLPDLMNYTEQPGLIAELGSDRKRVEETWVNTIEGAEITGYNVDYLRQIAYKMWRQPENERVIKVRFRAHRYELWLPELVYYIENTGHGPHPKRAKKT
jgi:hypothetical protein